MTFQWVKKKYETFCYIIFNCLIVFLIFEFVYFQFSSARHRQSASLGTPKTVNPRLDSEGYPAFLHEAEGLREFDAGQRKRLQTFIDTRGFRDMGRDEMMAILKDNGTRPGGKIYLPYIQYAQGPERLRTLNVHLDDSGFPFRERANRSLSDDDYTVYLFGGSTTYGYFMADQWTVSARLEYHLKSQFPSAKVRNYGQSGWSWFQELVLFQRLLQQGHRPNAVVFFDGVNTSRNRITNVPTSTKKIEKLWELAQRVELGGSLPELFSIFNRINFYHRTKKIAPLKELLESRYPQPPGVLTHSSAWEANRLLRSYMQTTSMALAIADAYRIDTYFVWQPHKPYRCEMDKYRVQASSHRGVVQELYRRMESAKIENHYNLSSLCQNFGAEDFLFVDSVHYSRTFSDHIGKKIAELFLERAGSGAGHSPSRNL